MGRHKGLPLHGSHLTFHIWYLTSHTIYLLKIIGALWEGTQAFPCMGSILHFTSYISHHLSSKNHCCILGRHMDLPLHLVTSCISHLAFHPDLPSKNHLCIVGRHMDLPLHLVTSCISHLAFHILHFTLIYLLKIICALWEGTQAFPCTRFHLTFHILHFTPFTF